MNDCVESELAVRIAVDVVFKTITIGILSYCSNNISNLITTQ